VITIYAKDNSISFNASKSKCLVILPANRRCLNDYVRNCTFMSEIIRSNMQILLYILDMLLQIILLIMKTFLDGVTNLSARLITFFVSSVN